MSLVLWSIVFLVWSILLLAISLSGIVGDGALVEWEFFDCCSVSFGFPIVMDYTSVLFSMVVSCISMCVFCFSVWYMGESDDSSLRLFGVMVSGFVLAMNVLIFVPSLVSLLLGWDGLGIVSFMLVIFYPNKSSLSGGMLTVLTNRIGDGFLILCVGLGVDFGDFGAQTVSSFGAYGWVIAVLVVLASMTKSAQIPFSAWLPAAMAAPTPVSALVHSSTLVTAGVYVLFRFYPMLMSVDGLLWVLSKIGCLTALLGSFGACLEMDVKKLIALSTLSHLGIMVYALGSGYPYLAMFHLFMHALFKSLLFLCAGYFMHVSGSCQDVRQLCGVGWWSCIPVCCVTVGLNSLTGFMALSGFYSKDGILESCIISVEGPFEIFCLLVSAGTSCVYSSRIFTSVIFGPSGASSLGICEEESFLVSVPLIILVVGSVLGGFFFQAVWADYCELVIMDSLVKVLLFVGLNVGNLFVVSRGVGCGCWDLIGFSKMKEKLCLAYLSLVSFVGGMMNLRFVSSSAVMGVWLRVGVIVSDSLENGWMEVMGGQGVFKGLSNVISVGGILGGEDILTMLRFHVMIVVSLFLFLGVGTFEA